MSRGRRALASLLLLDLALWSAPLVRAQDAANEPAPVPAPAPTEAPAQGLAARLVGPDRRPWPGRQVRVVDAAQRTLTLATTDAQGRFVLPAPVPGGYWVLVGGLRARVELGAQEVEGRELVIVAGRSLLDEEPPIPMADGLLPVENKSNTVLIVVGSTILLVGVGVTAGVIGYNAVDTTNPKYIYVPVSPFTP